MARDRMCTGNPADPGKILNVEKASIEAVFINAEIKTMINAWLRFSEGYGRFRYYEAAL